MTRSYKALSRLLLTGILMGAIGGSVEARPRKAAAKTATSSVPAPAIQTVKPAYKPAAPNVGKPFVGHAVLFGETPAVSSFTAQEGWSVDESLVREMQEINELNSINLFTPNPNSKPQSDGA
ncbi:MAG: hypothetical protein M3128_04690, partial [Verrucomicrobiota bacterium]|nr:hypothetical protein [Verrucomicrobiota bacterium]